MKMEIKKMNKKAQNVTEPWTIIMILVFVATVTTAMFSFGADVASDPDNTLDEESVLYIFDRSGFSLNQTISSSDSTNAFFTSDTDNEGNLKDFALEFQFYREQSSGIRVLIQDLWQLPEFFISGLGLDRETWSSILNIWNTIIWTIILYAIYRFLRGRIR